MGQLYDVSSVFFPKGQQIKTFPLATTKRVDSDYEENLAKKHN
jgi:hypothetical protein